MRVLVTGAGGFVGKALVQRLLSDGECAGRPLGEVIASDLITDGLPDDPRLKPVPGDLSQASIQEAFFSSPVDVVFHLASVPGGMAEQQPALARRINVDATLDLWDRCRQQVLAGGPMPRVVFASSIAVYGLPMPDEVHDHTPPSPQMTYGAHKWMAEIALADASRRGWADGLSLRLPGVLARPRQPTGQLSAFISNLLHDVSQGRAFVCPTHAQATTWASSLSNVVDNLLHGARVDTSRLSAARTLLLPTRRFSMEELVAATASVFAVSARVDWAPDAQIERLFGRFPVVVTAAAESLGFTQDRDLAALVQRALAPR